MSLLNKIIATRKDRENTLPEFSITDDYYLRVGKKGFIKFLCVPNQDVYAQTPPSLDKQENIIKRLRDTSFHVIHIPTINEHGETAIGTYYAFYDKSKKKLDARVRDFIRVFGDEGFGLQTPGIFEPYRILRSMANPLVNCSPLDVKEVYHRDVNRLLKNSLVDEENGYIVVDDAFVRCYSGAWDNISLASLLRESGFSSWTVRSHIKIWGPKYYRTIGMRKGRGCYSLDSPSIIPDPDNPSADQWQDISDEIGEIRIDSTPLATISSTVCLAGDSLDSLRDIRLAFEPETSTSDLVISYRHQAESYRRMFPGVETFREQWVHLPRENILFAS